MIDIDFNYVESRQINIHSIMSFLFLKKRMFIVYGLSLFIINTGIQFHIEAKAATSNISSQKQLQQSFFKAVLPAEPKNNSEQKLKTCKTNTKFKGVISRLIQNTSLNTNTESVVVLEQLDKTYFLIVNSSKTKISQPELSNFEWIELQNQQIKLTGKYCSFNLPLIQT